MIEQIRNISVDVIDDPKLAMRSNVDDDGIDELVASIKMHGLIQPITVRPTGSRFEVIAGHRRFRAHQLANLAAIPCIVREADDKEATVLKMHENLLRRDVDVVDEACFIGELVSKQGFTIKTLAEQIRRSEEYIKSRLAVFEMPEYMQDHLRLNRYPLGAALWLNLIRDERARSYYANYAAQNGTSVAQAQRWCNSLNQAPSLTPEEIEKIRAQGGDEQSPDKYVPCAKCAEMLKLTDAEYVFVHRICPPKN